MSDQTKPQERPNYKLRYYVQFRDDSFCGDHQFCAKDEEEARQTASNFIKERNEEDRKRIEQGQKSQWDWGCYSALSLLRLEYVIEEVVKEKPVPLQGDLVHRLAGGEAINLSELGNS